MGHGGRGRRQKNLPEIPGLPVPDSIEPEFFGTLEQYWAASPSDEIRPSGSRFVVPVPRRQRPQHTRRPTRNRDDST